MIQIAEIRFPELAGGNRSRFTIRHRVEVAKRLRFATAGERQHQADLLAAIKVTVARFKHLPCAVNIKVGVHDEMVFLLGTVDASSSWTDGEARAIIIALQSQLDEFLQRYPRSDFTLNATQHLDFAELPT